MRLCILTEQERFSQVRNWQIFDDWRPVVQIRARDRRDAFDAHRPAQKVMIIEVKPQPQDGGEQSLSRFSRWVSDEHTVAWDLDIT